MKTKSQGRQIARMHPQDAGTRGIRDHDIILLANERGSCLAAVNLSEQMLPGVVQLPTGAWFDPEDPLADVARCVHGNPNVLTRDHGTSSLAQGCTGQLTAVEVTRYNRELPPIRTYDPPVAL